jgi:demethylmenaquinone methyltransferase/2-methoxy-6-polyprenyl-1,4-benzoquinol methylase
VTEDMVRYYARRASEYERVYATPAWQPALVELRRRVATLFAGRRVFEVACGTGYWTEDVAAVAASVYATDVNEETLALARARPWPRGNVTFARGDAYAPSAVGRAFDAGLAGLWLSHVDRARLGAFVDAFHSHLEDGAPVLLFDERDHPRRLPRDTRADAAGNRYEARTLESGEHFEIIKNFFDAEGLRALLGRRARRLVFEELRGFWLATYDVSH